MNKEGLIEVVGNDIPRIDYTDSADGALLLEPSRTNKLVYLFTTILMEVVWLISDITATASINSCISPDGTLNATQS